MTNKSKVKPLDIQRRLVAYKTSQAWQQIPHVSFLYEPDVTDFYREYRALRESMREKGEGLSLNTLLLKVVAEGLKAAPDLNASFSFNPGDYSGQLEVFESVHIGVPWLLKDGKMITLTVFDAGAQTLSQISGQVAALKRKVEHTDFNRLFLATAGGPAYNPEGEDTLRPADILGGTVTVSNLGSICRVSGSVALLEILPPQVFAVGIAALQDRPGVFVNAAGEKEIGIRQVIPLCLAFDHRAFDFGDVQPFIRRLEEIFQHPEEIRNW